MSALIHHFVVHRLIVNKEEKIEARCEFCGKVYNMSPDEVKTEMAKATGDPARDSDFNENQ